MNGHHKCISTLFFPDVCNSVSIHFRSHSFSLPSKCTSIAQFYIRRSTFSSLLLLGTLYISLKLTIRTYHDCFKDMQHTKSIITPSINMRCKRTLVYNFYAICYNFFFRVPIPFPFFFSRL